MNICGSKKKIKKCWIPKGKFIEVKEMSDCTHHVKEKLNKKMFDEGSHYRDVGQLTVFGPRNQHISKRMMNFKLNGHVTVKPSY